MSEKQAVSVRFPLGLAAAARSFAQQDGMSVSAWMRRLIDREIAARDGKCPTCGSRVPTESTDA